MLLALIGLGFGVPVLVAVARNISFGYDEAVFAQLTRHWLTGAPASGWDIHRPPAISLLGVLVQAIGAGAEWSFRLIGIASGTGVVVASWAIAKRVGGARAGIIAVVALAAAPPLQVESASFLTDVPSTLVLLVLTAAVWRAIDRDTTPAVWSWVVIGFLGAAAFYLRYGAIVSVAGVAVGAAVAAPSVMRAHWNGVAAAAVAFAVLLLPHAVMAIGQAGAPWGILVSAGRAAGGSTSPPILSYLGWFPWALVGPLGALLAFTAVASGVRSIVMRQSRQEVRRGSFRRFAGVAVAVQLAVLGTVIHPEPRYVLFPMTLLVILGAAEAGRLLEARRWPGWLRPALLTATVSVLALSAVATTAQIEFRAGAFDWKREVGRDIRSEVLAAGQPSCSVLTSDVPIVSWYSGCPAVNFVGGPLSGRLALLSGEARYVVIRTDGHLQPGRDEIAATVLPATELWQEIRDGDGRVVAHLYRVRAARAAHPTATSEPGP